MSQDFQSKNPYAPPVIQASVVQQQGGQFIYRDGNLLVMHQNAYLPNRCAKSNEPTTERLVRTLYWHHPAFYLIILINLLLYLIVALIVRRKARIELPLSPRYKKRRLIWMAVSWGLVLTAIAFLFLSMIMVNQPQGSQLHRWSLPVFLSFPILLLTGLLTGIFGCRVVYAKRIHENFVWLAGTGEEFRNSFPDWPYPK